MLLSMAVSSCWLLKKASCLFQNAKREKCDFLFSYKINDLAVADFDKTSMFYDQALKFTEFQQPASAERADFLLLNFGNDWLSNMHEIGLPEAVSWLSWTPFSAGLLLLLLLGGLRALWRYCGAWCQNQYRRQARQQLQQLHALRTQQGQRVAAAQGLAQLVRQVALTAWPRGDVAALLGDAWLDFLHTTGGGAEAVPELLAQLSSLPASHLEQLSGVQWQALIDWTDQWIRCHRVALDDSLEVFDAGV